MPLCPLFLSFGYRLLYFETTTFLSSLDTTLKQHMIQATTTEGHFQPIVGDLFFLILQPQEEHKENLKE